MAVITKDLGPVSAYAVAVAHGYTGTEAEWEAAIAGAAIAGEQAVAAAAAAAQSETTAVASATAANRDASAAQVAEINAASSATAAAASQTAAAGSANAAASSQGAAEAAKVAAQAAKTDAQTAAASATGVLEQSLKMINSAINNFDQLLALMPDPDDNTKANFNSALNGYVYLIGFTPNTATYPLILNMPVRASGTVMTFSRSASYTAAACQLYITNAGAVYVRAKTTGTWGGWHELAAVPEIPTEYYVGPTREHTSLVALLQELEGDTRKKTIYMDPGTYDIFADYLANDVPVPPADASTEDYKQYNVFLPQNTKLVGIGTVTLNFMPTSEQITVSESKIWSPLNLWYGGNTIENVTIHVKNCRYAIHDDSHSEYLGFVNYIKNVRVIAEANDTGFGMASAIGYGFSDQSTYIFEDCDFYSSANGAAFYGHDGGTGGSQVIVRNCVIRTSNANNSTVRLQSIRKQIDIVAPIMTRFEGCYIGGGIYLQSYREDSGQLFDTVLLHSGTPTQTVDLDPNPYPIAVYE